MGFSAQAGEAACGVDSADVWADGFEGGEGVAFGFDFTKDVFADGDAEVSCRPGEPAAFFLEEV